MLAARGSGRRPAFTLVEMLVSSALIIFMMYILASAFEKGIETFRLLKSAGDLQERLRAASTVMRSDLTRQHFESEDALRGGHLSDQRLDDKDWKPPTKGFFRVFTGVTQGRSEGIDPDGPGSPNGFIYRRVGNNAAQHFLQFTIRVDSDNFAAERYFATNTNDATATQDGLLHNFSTPDCAVRVSSEPPSSTFTSRWAEVTYFLWRPTQGFDTAGGVTPLYGLYRRQRLLVDSASNLPACPNDPYGQYADVSSWGTTFNKPSDITKPYRRFGSMPANTALGQAGYPSVANLSGTTWENALMRPMSMVYGTSNPMAGADLVLADVLSFEVKALWQSPVYWSNTTETSPFSPVASDPNVANPDYPFDYLPNNGKNPQLTSLRIFDTWSAQNDTQPTLSYGPEDPATGKWNAGYFVTTGRPPSGGRPVGTAAATTIPLRVRVKALQLKLRIWDPKTRQTRQITMIQDM